MNKTNIEWCDFTLNPVVGCKRNCIYCYARKTHNKRHKTYLKGKLQMFPQYAKPFNEIQFFFDRLLELRRKKTATIFIDSYSDPEYWSDQRLDMILAHVHKNKQHKIMILTKNPDVYKRVYRWPENMWLGLTVTGEFINDDIENLYKMADNCYYNNTFISVEPIMGPFKSDSFLPFDQVIVGAMTKPETIKPRSDWLESIRHPNIFWKDNIKKYL